MADILQYLTQQAHKAQLVKQTLTRPAIGDYEMQDNEYRLPLGKMKAEGGDV